MILKCLLNCLPFFQVWICIALSVPAVIASLIGLSKCINALNKRIGSKPIENNSGGSIQIIDYVVCVILSQGAKCLDTYYNIKNNTRNWNILSYKVHVARRDS